MGLGAFSGATTYWPPLPLYKVGHGFGSVQDGYKLSEPILVILFKGRGGCERNDSTTQSQDGQLWAHKGVGCGGNTQDAK